MAHILFATLSSIDPLCLGSIGLPRVSYFVNDNKARMLTSCDSGILNIPILVVAKVISMKKAKGKVKLFIATRMRRLSIFSTEALAASTVKVKGRDVLATWKFLVGLVLIPTLYGLYTLVMFAYTMKQDWTWTWRILVSLATWNLLPFVSYASMRFGENGMDVYK